MRTIAIVGISAALLLFVFSFYIYTSDVAAISEVKIQLNGIEITKPTLYNVTMIIQMNISNPTDRMIQDLSSTFDIYIGENNIGSGEFQDVTVNARDNTIKSVKTVITYKGLALSAIDFIDNLIKGEKTTVTIQGTMTSKVFFGLTQTTQDFTATITTS